MFEQEKEEEEEEEREEDEESTVRQFLSLPPPLLAARLKDMGDAAARAFALRVCREVVTGGQPPVAMGGSEGTWRFSREGGTSGIFFSLLRKKKEG